MIPPSGSLRLRDLWGANGPNWKYLPHAPSPKQNEFINYACKEGCFGGAAGGGKSDALLMAALQGIDIPQYSAILFRRTFQDLRLAGSLMDRAHTWWDNTGASWNGDDKTFTFPTGARIGFGYLDGPRDHLRYQSAEYHMVGFDEGSQFFENQVLYLLSRCRKTLDFPSWMPIRHRMGTNPGGVGHEWIKHRYKIPDLGTKNIIEIFKGGKLTRVFVPSLAVDNPGLDVPDYLEQLSELDEVTRAQLERGEWIADSSGLVYFAYRPEHCDIECLPKDIAVKEWRFGFAMDYGSTTDKTSLAVCAYSPHEPAVYGVWCEEHKGMSPSEAAVRALELEEQFGGFEFMVGDAGGLGAGYILEMQKHWAIPIEPAQKRHKLAYIRLMNGELSNGRFRVIPDFCNEWCQQAKSLMWKNPNHLIEHPGQHNDSTDSMLYCWRECRHYATHERTKPKLEDPYEQRALEEAEKRKQLTAVNWEDPFGMRRIFDMKDGVEGWNVRW